MANTADSVVMRLSQLPVVTSACNWGLRYYDSAKSSNVMLKRTLETAEVSLKMVADTARPVVNKLEKPIAMVDNLACKALSKLQENYPSINKTPDEISAETKAAWALVPSQYANVKDYGIQKLNAIKETMASAFSTLETQFDHVATTTLNGALHNADLLVDYLIPSEAANETQLNTDDPIGTKLKKLSSKVGSRISAKAQEFETFQKVQSSSISTYQVLHVYVEFLQMQTKLVWGEFNKELDATEKKLAGNSFNEFLVNTYATWLQSFQTRMSRAKLYGGDVLHQVSEVVLYPVTKARSIIAVEAQTVSDVAGEN